MRHPVQLQILEPCHENWEQMTLKQQGRFCGSCQKTVMDFSAMSDSQLLHYFKNYTGNTCGHFENGQLSRPLLQAPPQKSGWWKWAVATMVSFLMISNKGKTQGDVLLKGKVAMKTECREPLLSAGKMPTAKEPQLKSTRIELKGRIVDENGSGIPYASVQVKSEKWGVSADSLGNYSLKMVTTKDAIAMVCSATGFENGEKHISVHDAAKQIQDISLASNAELKEVIVTGYGTLRRTYKMGELSMVSATWFEDQAPVIEISPLSGSIYPNPAKAGSAIYLPFKSAGYYGLRLVDVSGKVLFTQPAVAAKAGQVQRFTLTANIAAGYYVVQILDAEGKIATNSKLIVTD